MEGAYCGLNAVRASPAPPFKIQNPKFNIVKNLLPAIALILAAASEAAARPCPCECDTLSAEEIDALWASITPDSLIQAHYAAHPPMLHEPRIFGGLRSISLPDFTPAPPRFSMFSHPEFRADSLLSLSDSAPLSADDALRALISNRESLSPADSTTLPESAQSPAPSPLPESAQSLAPSPLPEGAYCGLNEVRAPSLIPAWLRTAMSAERLQQDLLYSYMMAYPRQIQYAYWELPAPPRLPEEDHSFEAYLRKLDLPEIDTSGEDLPERQLRRINWLHTVSGSLQLSQAFISSNWYQGGNNYFAILFNFGWNVALNQAYHPNLLFDSDLSYKLAINSTPKGSLHKYSVSQDLFQYNLKLGLKAFRKWFYSFNLQFKTQLLNQYEADSEKMLARFMSPADLNLGLGMTYSTTGRRNTLKFSASISPISYNLKTCFTQKIDHSLFNIPQTARSRSEIGSNAELNLTWDITRNISWKSRLFLFTNYEYFLGDWENTFNFTINKFLSTQLYVHPRYDTSTDASLHGWRHWQLKEILSFGLSYTFTTKP